MDIHDVESGAFVQDNFRINRKLTLSLALRRDVFTPQTEAKNRQANFGPATGTMRVAIDVSTAGAITAQSAPPRQIQL